VVEIVGENVQRRVGDDPGDVAVGEAVRAQTGHVLVADLAAFGHNLFCENQGRFGFRVGGFGGAGRECFVRGQTGLAAEQSVGRNAVVAGVGFANHEGNLLLQFPWERAFRQRTTKGEISVGRSGRLRERGDEIRHEAETFLHIGEDLLLFG
jgi:hypothetical protein